MDPGWQDIFNQNKSWPELKLAGKLTDVVRFFWKGQNLTKNGPKSINISKWVMWGILKLDLFLQQFWLKNQIFIIRFL